MWKIQKKTQIKAGTNRPASINAKNIPTSPSPDPSLMKCMNTHIPPIHVSLIYVFTDFTNWAWYRPGVGKYRPEDIDPTICTHVVYGFAVLDSNNLIIKPHDSWADLDNQFYKKVTSLKKYGIKVTVAIGGWNDSLGGKYSKLVNNPAARAKFVSHVVEFVEKHGFDGLGMYVCIFLKKSICISSK